MRIITKCVIDIATCQVLLEEGYEYQGQVAFCSGGGQKSETTNQSKPWHKQVPPETYGAYQKVMPLLESKATQGLTPEEEAYYRGKSVSDIGKTFAGAKTTLEERLGRMGIRGGAAAEQVGELERSKAMSQAKAFADLMGTDIERKDVNIDRLLRAISIPGSPQLTGSVTTTKGGGS